MLTVLIVAGAALAGAVAFRKVIHRSEDSTAIELGDRVSGAAASWLSGLVSMSPGDTARELKEMRGGKSSAKLMQVLRIEYELEKRGPDEIALKVTAVWHTQNGKTKIGRIEENLTWHEVPADVRAAFIRGEKALAFVWLDPHVLTQ